MRRSLSLALALVIMMTAVFSSCLTVSAANSKTTALKKMANFYINNVKTCSSSKTVYCKLIKQDVRADSSGFVSAYMSLVSGKKVGNYSTSQLVKKQKSLTKKGFKYLTTDKTKGTKNLKKGDILVANDGVYSYCSGSIAMVYISKSKSFGWNQGYSKYPITSKTYTTKKSNGHYVVSDGNHKFYGVWRYTGK